MTTENNNKPKSFNWLIYHSLIISGLILLADGFEILYFDKWTVKIGIALLFTAFSFIVGAGNKKTSIAVGIIWGAILSIYFL